MSDEIQINKKLLGAVAVFVLLLGMAAIFAAGAGKAQPPQAAQAAAGSSGGAQDIYIHANAGGTYDKSALSVKSGVPVKLHFTADPNAGCGRQIVIYGLGVSAISRSGEEAVVEFTPTAPGTYQYSCGMRMWGPGTLTVQ